MKSRAILDTFGRCCRIQIEKPMSSPAADLQVNGTLFVDDVAGVATCDFFKFNDVRSCVFCKLSSKQ